MDFPARPPAPAEAPPGLLAALGGEPREVLRARDHLVVYDSAAEIAALKPDLAALVGRIVGRPSSPLRAKTASISCRGFLPRHRACRKSPVTGSSHTTLAPYWAKRLGKTELEARQISRRGGALRCTLNGDRVSIAGRAVLYLEGTIEV